MGLTKQYLAYQPYGNFNIIASARVNPSFVTVNSTEGRYIAVGAAENVIVWDVRLGLKAVDLGREKQEVTALRSSPDKLHLAVGYADGKVEIFNLKSRESECLLAVHKNAVAVLRYDALGMKLVSGGLDTDVVVSDVISQQGKYRLTGHTSAITDVCFYEKTIYNQIVISSSKDTQVKFWNFETQYCFKTLVDHRTEVWGIALMRNMDYLVTGSRDSVLNVYKLSANDAEAVLNVIDDPLLEDETASPLNCTLMGTIQRGGHGRTMGISTDNTGQVLACFGTNNQIELFYFFDETESLKRLTKRLKKAKITDETNDEGPSDAKNTKDLSLSDEVRRLPSIKTTDKIKSMDLLVGGDHEMRVVVTLANNTLQMYTMRTDNFKEDPKLSKSIVQQGHHSEVRALCFSSDNYTIASGSGDSLKLWNRTSMNCIKTIATGYILTVCFVPGDRHILLGLKNGHLLIADTVTGSIIEDIPAHTDELWSICLQPDSRGCATGGGDTTVKLWSFELIPDPTNESSPKILSLLHQNTLKLEENVLAVRISPNSKFIAVALLDSTMKIFFLDSFKFYLSLYGHKLPVLCMDISYDNALIASGSADRNIKVWGMDFGDCHRSMFAHNDSVMSLQFIPNTHMFFTCGKDGKIKQWDGDNFQKILTISGHVGEAYGLAVSPNALFMVSCGSDRMIRLFERTDEIIVLEDAQQEEREELENRIFATGEESTAPGLPALKLPSKKTIGAERAAESILECLDLTKAVTEDDDTTELKSLMQAYQVTTPLDYLTSVLSRIRTSDLEEALLILPFTTVIELLGKLPLLIESRKDHLELFSKITFFLFRIHQRPIANNQTIFLTIRNLFTILSRALTEYRDLVGTNYYGLQLLQRDFEQRQGIEMFGDATRAKKQKDKREKHRNNAKKRLHIQMTS